MDTAVVDRPRSTTPNQHPHPTTPRPTPTRTSTTAATTRRRMRPANGDGPTAATVVRSEHWAITDGWPTRSCAGASVRRRSSARDQSSPRARLAEAQHVAGGIAEGAVADAVWLVDRLLQHLATRGADSLESGVAVVGGEDDTVQQTLR
jgi:hypothetical protein